MVLSKLVAGLRFIQGLTSQPFIPQHTTSESGRTCFCGLQGAWFGTEHRRQCDCPLNECVIPEFVPELLKDIPRRPASNCEDPGALPQDAGP